MPQIPNHPTMATGGSGGGALPVEQIFQLLDSADTVDDIKAIILENLQSTKETWLIHLLVDHYFQTQSPNVQDIFTELKESQAKALLEKIQDGLKCAETRQSALQLVLYLAYKEIPWCHQIVDTALFSSILKIMKTETDVPVLMTSLMAVVILLPSLPVSIGPHLQTVFEIFGRVSMLCSKNPASTPEVFVLYLQVALYSLFHRLYGMYPCSFMSFIRKFYSNKENIHSYENIVLPMIERVRLHPKLIMGQKETESSKNIWKNQETQDIIVACSRLSLDYIEGSGEDTHCPVFHSLQAVDKFHQMSLAWKQHKEKKASVQRVKSQAVAIPGQDAAPGSPSSLAVPSLDFNGVGESPSILLGLSTPPNSQRATPASSFLEPGPTHASDHGTGDNTSGQQTPCQGEEGEKTPLSRSSSRGAFQTLKSTSDPKKPAATKPGGITPVTPGSSVSHSLPWMSPVVVGGSTEPSPFKSKCSAFEQPKTSAMRTLTFNPALAGTEEEVQGERAVPAITLQVATESPKPLPHDDEQAKPEKDDQTPVKAATPSIACDTDREIEHKTPETDQTNSAVGGAGQSTLDSLSQIVEKMAVSDADNVDQEVEEINEKDDHFDESAALTSSSSTLTSGTEVTAESVRQFMKKVNRIRFNSLTSNSSSNSDADVASLFHATPHSDRLGHQRPQSCPPFKRGRVPIPGLERISPPRVVGHRHGNLRSGSRRKQFVSSDRSAPLQQRRRSRPAFMTQKSHPGDSIVAVDALQSEDSSDDIVSLASPSAPAQKSCPVRESTLSHDDLHQSSLCEEPALDVVPALPEHVNAVFQCILAPSKLAVCSSCHQHLVVTSGGSQNMEQTLTGRDISLFSTITPPELLDRHLRLGSDLHAKELTKIPLTSKESTNWTHFGGLPPADEVSILRGQILLMQTQIMYERHKRLNHGKRNRRLLRRMTHVASLEEQQRSLQSQIKLYEEEIQQLSVSVRLLQEDNRQLRHSQESDEYEKLVEFKTSLKQNKDLKASSIGLKNLLITQKEDYDKQQKKLQAVEHKNMEHEQELRICKDRLALTDRLKQQVLQLQNEVLLTQEFHQKCQEKLHQGTSLSRHKTEESYLINALRAEIRLLKEENKMKSNQVDAFQARMQEMEELVKSKDKIIAEIKQSFDATKSCHNAQLQVLEERCAGLLRTNQHLECELMELVGQLDQAQHRRMAEARRAVGRSSATPATSAPSGLVANRGEVTTPGEGDNPATSGGRRGSGLVEPIRRQNQGRDNNEDDDPADRKDKDKDTRVGGQGPAEVMQGSVPSQAETLPDSGAGSRGSYLMDSDASDMLGDSVNTADSGCWPRD